jgi:hypothetical protein
MAAIFDDLDPGWKTTALAIDADLKAQGIKCVYAEGVRDLAKQQSVFLAGNSRCDGIKAISLHQARLACDWVALDDKGNRTWDYVKYSDTYKAIRDTIIKHGGEAGGSWLQGSKFLAVGLGWDPPHGQIKA